MVLGPVKLDATTDPGTSQSHEGRLDNVIVIHKVALLDLVVRHLDTSTQFGHHHHFDILILQEHHLPLVWRGFIGYRLNHGIWIHHPTRALIDAFLQEYRILLGLSYFIGRYGNYFSPGFYGLSPRPRCEGGSSYLIVSYVHFDYIFVLVVYTIYSPPFREGLGVDSTSSFSNCSKVLPLVSGQCRQRKIKAHTQMPL